MHFLVSQSIFLARLEYFYSFGDRVDAASFSDVGFSPSAIITTCSIGFGMITAQVLHALRPLDNRIPIQGNASAVISAMCHYKTKSTGSRTTWRQPSATEQEVQETSISTLPLMWGVTQYPNESFESRIRNNDEVNPSAGHCSFSADTVELPEIGKKYR